ncbi:MAG: hypothetical protein GX896_06775 [Clostridiales bacterium]|nr:hypothetical protein [Clostridiales bacterium]
MSTESEKLRRFSNAVYSVADKEAAEIIASATNTHNNEIQSANDSSLGDAYFAIKEDVKNIQQKYIKIVATQELKSKKVILNHREKLASKVFENVKSMLNDFKNSDDYSVFLSKHLENIVLENPKKTGVVYLSPSDIKYSDALSKIAGDSYTFQEKKSIKLGGLSVYYPEENILCDNTIDSAFEEQIDKFHKKADFKLK